MRTLFALLVIGILTLAMLGGCTMEQTMNGGGTATATTENNQPVDSNNNTTLPPATTPEPTEK